jgi:hypothetical protein
LIANGWVSLKAGMAMQRSRIARTEAQGSSGLSK